MIPLNITRKTANKVQPPEQFARSPITFGSGPGCDVRFDPVWDRGAASLHGRLEWRGEGWVIIDAGSATGTWVNGARISNPQPLLRAVDIELGKGGASLRVEPAHAGKKMSVTLRAALALGAVILLIGVGWLIGLKARNALKEAGSNQGSRNAPETSLGVPGFSGGSSPSPSPNGTSRRYAMGLVALSAAERTYLEKSVPTAESVSLNALAVERGARASSREKEAAALKPAGFGSELHSVLREKGVQGSTPLEGAEEAQLPRAVDNSKLPCFPPIGDQAELGSCASFSTTYYAASHNMGVARKGGQSGDRSRELSPKWTYAMVNGGLPSGSTFLPIMNFLERHGAPTLAEWPYTGKKEPPSNYREWPTNPEIWRSALKHRFKESGAFRHVDTPKGLALLKAFIADGYVANFGTSICHWVYSKPKTDPNAPSSAGADEDVCSYVRSRKAGEEHDGHALTVVGYDDNLWVDANKNGIVDPGETGALKIANSWGTAGWPADFQRDGARVGKGGFVWILYDALKHQSGIPGFTPEDRSTDEAGFHDDAVYYVVPYPDDYEPKIVAQFTVEADQRDEIDVRFGIATAGDAKKPEFVWRPGALTLPQWSESLEKSTGMGGPFGMNGEQGRSGATCVFDLTDLLNLFSANTRKVQIFMMINKLSPNASVALNDFKVLDAHGKTLITATGLPIQIDAGMNVIPVQVAVPAE